MERVATFAERLEEVLRIKGMQQYELSDLTDISRTNICRYLKGQSHPRQKKLYEIAYALNISEMWLLGYNVPMNSKDQTLLNVKDEIIYKLNLMDESKLEKLKDFIDTFLLDDD